jgi:hypothetical protein
MDTQSNAETRDEFEDTPRDWARLWNMEFEAARKWAKDWHDSAKRAFNVFSNERAEGGSEVLHHSNQRLNLFYANVNTLQALLYGAPPKVTAKRRFADSEDDVARVGGEIIQRLLNTDVERDDDGYTTALGLALQDSMIAGLGLARCRYVVEWETVTTPAVPGPPDPVTGEATELAPEVQQEVKTFEDVEIDHVNWDDQLWSPCRRFGDMRWWAQRVYMSRDSLIDRFGEEIGRRIPLNAKGMDSETGSAPPSPWSRAEIWEIWSKEHRKVFWFCLGHDQILDMEDDPYRLRGFWPFPRPLVSNVTTRKFLPRPDYEIARDMYEDCNTLARRIALLEDCISVKGAYDSSCGELQSLVTKSGENMMIPVDNWAMFAEKGGIQGAVNWFPIDVVVAVVDRLSQKLVEKINLLYQVTGMSDIMRGASQAGATATEQAIKARFAGVRTQSAQQKFASFASAIQSIRSEIMCSLFDADTMIRRSNISMTQDRDLAMQAVQMLKEKGTEYRISVDPDSVSLTDMTALKAERTEFLGVFSGLLNVISPLAQIQGGMQFALEILKWVTASMKGASGIEGVMDNAIAAVKQAEEQQRAQPPKPDPKLEVERERQLGALEREGVKAQADLAIADKENAGKIMEQRAQMLYPDSRGLLP